ncbi:YDG/SRA domain-containing protein [Salirhabdus sp. Marseille-P4669]|uniref:YDG/SRA domain-containing protein n=1 Tax=Salirhabdus sp. Marseille-P4669 TaxID=2042310 RepID=UPI000C7CCE26|nr:YDG/SRA domain-containing protein [Salirhabdus sp. Marseille-P4669]
MFLLSNLITVSEAAEKYAKHEETIRRWIREERLIPVKRASKGMYLVNEDEVEYLVRNESKRSDNLILSQLLSMNIASSNAYKISVGDKFTYKEFTEVINNRGVKGIRYRTGDPNVSIITTISGKHDNPYEDRFINDTLYYTGEGRNGDQELKFGNLRLYECQIEKTPVHVFQKVKDNHYMFLGMFRVMDYHIESQPDDNGKIRSVYTFEMKPIINEKYDDYKDSFKRIKGRFNEQSLIDEVMNIQGDLQKVKISNTNITKRYNRSRKLVENLKKLYLYECQLCDPSNPIPKIEMQNGKKYVEVHHIEGFSEVLNKTSEEQDSGDFVVDHVSNVVVVCPQHHKMFHHYKSPFRYINEKNAFVSEDGSKVLQLYHKHEWHNIGGRN